MLMLGGHGVNILIRIFVLLCLLPDRGSGFGSGPVVPWRLPHTSIVIKMCSVGAAPADPAISMKRRMSH